jgi:predicted Rossmann fold flavoprotein
LVYIGKGDILCYNPDITTSIHNYDVIVIGGGSSGMMAAGVAAQQGKRVLLLEKNASLGEKLKITGGGRCNITNAEEDIRVLLKHYDKAEQFLYSAFSQFGMKETFTFFESKNLPLVVQARKRAFPHTEKSIDVFNTMRHFVEESGVIVKTHSPVKKMVMQGGVLTGVIVGKDTYTANSYILATGGMSHPETGSTGDGFGWLGVFGHTVKSSTPTIVPIATREEWSKILSGTSLSFMKITFFADGKKSFTKTGKILFTHFGLSGPLILNSASKIGDMFQSGSRVTATIDAYPDTDLGALEDRIIKILDANKNKMLKNILALIVPEGMAPGIQLLLAHEIAFETKVHSISKEDRKKIVRILKTLPLTITNLMGYDRAVVADGGVSLSEIDTKTMRSKKVPNLLVTGDLLDITRPSGGYSLQLCWTTGYVAGMNA